MKYIIHRAEERGKANLGWLDTKYSFSFAEYFNPAKMGFGLLRVFNDDIVMPKEGFGTHPHNNMEIITIILEGQLEHRDSMGNGSIIQKNEVQVMSAGSGITHSEFNPSKDEKVNLLQLWIFPKEKNITPRYEQKVFHAEDRNNSLITVVTGEKSNDSLYIHQSAEIKSGKFDKNKKLKYSSPVDKGSYLFIISGHLKIEDEELFRRDAIGIFPDSNFEIEFLENSEFIIIDVPMNHKKKL